MKAQIIISLLLIASFSYLIHSINEDATPCPGCNVVVIVTDSMRRDSVGAYAGGSLTPNIDELAARSILYENSYSQASYTRPSIATLFTSVNPLDHRTFMSQPADLEPFNINLPQRFVTLAETFSENGYLTEAFVSNMMLDGFGYRQGFKKYSVTDHNDTKVTRRALRFLSETEGPFFAYVHFMDPHLPYTGYENGAPCTVEVAGRSLDVRRSEAQQYFKFKQHLRENGRATPEDIACMRKAYEEEVSIVDAKVGEVLSAIKGRDDKTIVVFISDHGSEFADHGLIHFGHSMYEELIRVPIIIGVPGAKPARHKGIARILDLYPTLLALTGITGPQGLQGQILPPYSENSDVQISVSENHPLLRAAVSLEGKYILHFGTPKFTDLADRPAELSEPLKQQLIAALETKDNKAEPAKKEDAEKLSEKLLQAGYI